MLKFLFSEKQLVAMSKLFAIRFVVFNSGKRHRFWTLREISSFRKNRSRQKLSSEMTNKRENRPQRQILHRKLFFKIQIRAKTVSRHYLLTFLR